MFNGQSILITVVTGSFGKRYTHTLLECYKPKEIITLFFDKLKLTMSDFCYDSGTNEHFLTVDETKQLLKDAKL